MKKVTLVIWFAVCFGLSVAAQEKTDNQYANLPIVDYCEVVRNPQLYNEKVVKIFGQYRAGFENSSLTNQACEKDCCLIWVEWGKQQSCSDSATAQILANRYKGNESNYLEGTFAGKLYVSQGSGFGHMNAKPFKLAVSCVENATLLPKEISGCTRVDKTSPFHYLEYVKTELGIAPNYEKKKKKGRTEQIVWLRLVNNSSCSTFVPTIGEKAKNLADGTNALVLYNRTFSVVARDMIMVSKKPDKPVTDRNPVSSILSSGKSIYFGVPLRYFLKGWNVIVSFKYTDRQAEEYYDPLYFSRQDLPENLLKK